MHQQHIAGAEIGHQIFGTAPKPGDDLALQPRHEILLEWEPQILAPRLGGEDFGAFHRRLQPATHGLDFGQLRQSIHPM